MPFLLLTRDSGAEERFPCRGDLLLIGRDAETAVRLDHQSVSRFHARLVNAGEERWLVEDLGSSNGTFVNGIRVTGQVPLGHGDSLRFGTLALSFQDPLTTFAPDPEANPEARTSPSRPASIAPALLLLLTAVALTSAAWMGYLFFTGRDAEGGNPPVTPGSPAVADEDGGEDRGTRPPDPDPEGETPGTETTDPTESLPPIPVAGGDPRPGRILPGDAPDPPDRITLADGTVLLARLDDSGERDPLWLEVEVRGVPRRIPREDVRAINDRPELPDWRALFAARRERATTVAGLEGLLEWCTRHDRRDERVKVAEALIAKVADHPGARAVLGGVLYRGQWLEPAAARTQGLTGPDGRLDGTPEDQRRIRRLFLDALRRSPTPAETVAALGMPPQALVDELLGRDEFHAAWCRFQARRLELPADLFAPGGALEKLPRELGEKGSDFQEASRALITSRAFLALCPDSKSYVRRTFQRLLGFGGTIDQRLFDAAVAMIDGERRAIFGQRGEGREAFIDIVLQQPRFYALMLSLEARRLRGRPLSRNEVRRGSLRLAANPTSLAAMRRDWLTGADWTKSLAQRRLKSRDQILGSVHPDLFGRHATAQEVSRLEGAVPATADLPTLVNVLARQCAGAAAAAPISDEAPIHRWCVRLLGRRPTAKESTLLQAAWKDPAAGPAVVVFALASSDEWLTY